MIFAQSSRIITAFRPRESGACHDWASAKPQAADLSGAHMAHQVDDIRTVALVGHEAAGKTSLADALLFKAKAVERRGSPEDGSSVSDFDEEEKKHKYSIDSSVLHLDYQSKRVYLI